MPYLGIIFALLAALCWGFGDFFIQRTSRKTGIMDAMFYITSVATVVLLPFVWTEIPNLDQRSIIILLVGGFFIFIASLFLFKSFMVGKLAIIEPVASLEMPMTVLIASFLGHELLGLNEYALIALIFIGILLSVTAGRHVFKNVFSKMEVGTWLAFGGAIAMALSNFTIGYASQQTSPLMSIWATSLVIFIACIIYYIFTGGFGNMIQHAKNNPGIVLAEVIFDNTAWIAYAFAVVYIPIAIVIAITESYIILAVVLGITLNRERLKHHQYFGVILAILGVLLLSNFAI